MAPGPTQILIIAVIILLLFGATRLSELGKGLGEGIRNFKKGIQDDEEPKAKSAVATTKKPKKRLPPRKSAPPDDESGEEEEEEQETDRA